MALNYIFATNSTQQKPNEQKKNIIIVKTFVSVSMNIDAFSHIFFVSMLFLVAASLHFHFYIYHNTKAKTATDYFAHIFSPCGFVLVFVVVMKFN